MKEVDIISTVVGRNNVGKSVGSTAPSMGAYALKSELLALQSVFNDFLEGDDTDTVINRWKELEAFLNGISEDNTLSSILGDYIPIQGYTDILGEKNFTGGLKVNGSPIVYDADNKYWKLEGDLLVTGGVTMYSSDTEFTPSTIMDAIIVDNVTIVKQDGKLVAVGGGSSGGGVADSVAWGNVLGKPSWITDTIPYVNIAGTKVSLGGAITQAGLRTALGLGSNAYSSTAYLPLTGGTITASRVPLTINRTDYTVSAIHFQANSVNVGRIGVGEDNNPKFMKAADVTWHNLWHAGNDGAGSGLDADLLDGKHYSDIINGNVASATKLQTARTIFGQSFDGTGNVDGLLSINGAGILYSNGSTTCYVGSDSIPNTYISGGNVNLRYGTNIGLILNSSGNVGIGTTSPSAKLSVVGNVNVEKPSTTNQASLSFMNTSSDLWQISGRFNKNVSADNDRLNFYYYNGTTWKKVMELDTSNNMSVTGNILAGGGITMYSDARKKTILNHVELSLKEIAEAPLIEHYYNSDENKTTHVGSIAQYWAGLNDWFCKLDNEGYYTMEIQNAALASAISVARELVKFETETDRRIRLLEEENEQLKKEIEILKWNIA